MSEAPGRRVLLVAADPEGRPLRELFAGPPLAGWEVVGAGGFGQARFVLQMGPACDAVLLDAGPDPAGDGDGDGLAWLAGRSRAPVVVLANAPAAATRALTGGASQWLPREYALRYPEVLAAALARAAEAGDCPGRERQLRRALRECRRRVDRLAGLLWEATPAEGRPPWFSQRYMLERLEEEVARSRRHGGPLAVALAEVSPAGRPPAAADEQRLRAWAAERVARGKRRSDVAGQYGPDGFLLLLPHTDDAGAVRCCRRLRDQLRGTPEEGAGPPPALDVRFGVACFSAARNTAKGLLSRAEERLERAKEGEAGGVEF
jgi:GGDEF domain-containing protein